MPRRPARAEAPRRLSEVRRPTLPAVGGLRPPLCAEGRTAGGGRRAPHPAHHRPAGRGDSPPPIGLRASWSLRSRFGGSAPAPLLHAVAGFARIAAGKPGIAPPPSGFPDLSLHPSPYAVRFTGQPSGGGFRRERHPREKRWPLLLRPSLDVFLGSRPSGSRPEICPPYPLAPVPLRGGALVALWSGLGKPPARSRASPCRRPLPPRFRGRSPADLAASPYTPHDLDTPPLPIAATGRPLRARPVWPLPFACVGSKTCGFALRVASDGTGGKPKRGPRLRRLHRRPAFPAPLMLWRNLAPPRFAPVCLSAARIHLPPFGRVAAPARLKVKLPIPDPQC